MVHRNKYPQAEYPYTRLVNENRRRGLGAPELELIDIGVFKEDRYFDLSTEHAKGSENDILIRLTIANRGREKATLHLLPTLWFRNTWSWGEIPEDCTSKPLIALERDGLAHVHHDRLGDYQLAYQGNATPLFTENETNALHLHGYANGQPFVKDAFHEFVVHGRTDAVNPGQTGTKFAPHYVLTIEPEQSQVVKLRLSAKEEIVDLADAFANFDQIFAQRIKEADEFYDAISPAGIEKESNKVARQGYAGLLWSKQFYNYVIRDWLTGDPAQPPPPPERNFGRNREWTHLFNRDIISMPDKWEYPWFAAWDLAFHMIPFSKIDPHFAKKQLNLFLREWYMHPNGQILAYEFAFGDVNPPVHAWAALRVYRIERRLRGKGDRAFLERVFHKLLLNFTWWVNRQDAEGKNVFQGGFLGLDNIGVFDRSAPLPTGRHIEQSDGTSWMGMYCLNMLAIALELARQDPAYEDVASKFFEHFVYIAHATRHLGEEGINLWDDADGFYYDVLHSDGAAYPMKVRSMVGLVPLFAVETLEPEIVDKLPGFKRRMQWFIDNHPEFREHVENASKPGVGMRRLLAIVAREQLPRVLRFMLDEAEFLAPHGVRALSRYHRDHPYVLHLDGMEHRVDYEPPESPSRLFGGNSNWRGPVWFPMNYLLIESLQKFHHFYGDTLKVPCPTGSATALDLWQVAVELSRRLTRIFLRDADGRRPVYGGTDKFQRDPHWRNLILFYEYFRGDNGAGIGAGHQTGWTGLVAKLLQQSGEG